MPRYAYRCVECDERFEGVSSMAERHDTRCPSCGSVCRIVVQPSQVLVPLYMSDRAPSRSDVTQESGLLVQGERDGW